MNLTNSEQLGLILAGVIMISIIAAVATFYFEKSSPDPESRKKVSREIRRLQEIGRKLGMEFDPNDPHDPVAALIAAGEYFRMPGCEPGGPHYEETFHRVLTMMEDLVLPDRLDFWTDQVYRLYGSGMIGRKQNPKSN